MPTRKDGTSKYTSKQERKAEHIEEGYKKKGVSAKEAESRAWATVNKQDGGGKNPGGYQGILLDGEMLQGASESRRDGRAVGY